MGAVVVWGTEIPQGLSVGKWLCTEYLETDARLGGVDSNAERQPAKGR